MRIDGSRQNITLLRKLIVLLKQLRVLLLLLFVSVQTQAVLLRHLLESLHLSFQALKRLHLLFLNLSRFRFFFLKLIQPLV